MTSISSEWRHQAAPSNFPRESSSSSWLHPSQNWQTTIALQAESDAWELMFPPMERLDAVSKFLDSPSKSVVYPAPLGGKAELELRREKVLTSEVERLARTINALEKEQVASLAAAISEEAWQKLCDGRISGGRRLSSAFRDSQPTIADANNWLETMRKKTIEQGKDFPNDEREQIAWDIQRLQREFHWTVNFVAPEGDIIPCTVCPSTLKGKPYNRFLVRAQDRKSMEGQPANSQPEPMGRKQNLSASRILPELRFSECQIS